MLWHAHSSAADDVPIIRREDTHSKASFTHRVWRRDACHRHPPPIDWTCRTDRVDGATHRVDRSHPCCGRRTRIVSTVYTHRVDARRATRDRISLRPKDLLSQFSDPRIALCVQRNSVRYLGFVVRVPGLGVRGLAQGVREFENGMPILQMDVCALDPVGRLAQALAPRLDLHVPAPDQRVRSPWLGVGALRIGVRGLEIFVGALGKGSPRPAWRPPWR
jgi:hypothetical protein